MEAENLDSLKFDQEGRIKTNANQRSGFKKYYCI